MVSASQFFMNKTVVASLTLLFALANSVLLLASIFGALEWLGLQPTVDAFWAWLDDTFQMTDAMWVALYLYVGLASALYLIGLEKIGTSVRLLFGLMFKKSVRAYQLQVLNQQELADFKNNDAVLSLILHFQSKQALGDWKWEDIECPASPPIHKEIHSENIELRVNELKARKSGFIDPLRKLTPDDRIRKLLDRMPDHISDRFDYVERVRKAIDLAKAKKLDWPLHNKNQVFLNDQEQELWQGANAGAMEANAIAAELKSELEIYATSWNLPLPNNRAHPIREHIERAFKRKTPPSV